MPFLLLVKPGGPPLDAGPNAGPLLIGPGGSGTGTGTAPTAGETLLSDDGTPLTDESGDPITLD